MNRWNLVAANPVTERFNRYKVTQSTKQARLRHLQALNNIKGQVNNR